MNRPAFARVLVILMSVCALECAAQAEGTWNGRVYDVREGHYLSRDQRRAALAGVEILVLGEKHDTPVVQLQQAQAISEALEANPAVIGRWVLGWEFLNRRDQRSIDEAWNLVNLEEKSLPELLDQFLGRGRSRSYLPILEVGVRYAGELRGLNLARDEKAPVVRGGIEALDPAILPPGFALGGAGYRERFEEAMGGHATPEQMQRYFEAQCLTDDVMAHELLRGGAPFRVLVNGSFHSDYFDAAITRIRARDAVSRLLSVRLIDASEYTVAELEALQLSLQLEHSRFGPLADWIWFAGEPQ